MVVTRPPLEGHKRITKDVPLRMPAGTLLDIAGISLMPQFPEGRAYSLGFLTGNQDPHFFTSGPLGMGFQRVTR